MEDEDEHALQRVKNGKKIGHNHGALVDVHKAERPGQAQQTQQGDGADHPGPAQEREVIENEQYSISCSVFLMIKIQTGKTLPALCIRKTSQLRLMHVGSGERGSEWGHREP